jgi:hypothetical protein
VALSDVMESGRHGHTGARKTGGIGFAALRGGQVVGEHTLIFAAATEHIALTHRAFDRRAFATGAVRAALWVVGRRPAALAGHQAGVPPRLLPRPHQPLELPDPDPRRSDVWLWDSCVSRVWRTK